MDGDPMARKRFSRIMSILFCILYAARTAAAIRFGFETLIAALPALIACVTGGILLSISERSFPYGCACLAAACAAGIAADPVVRGFGAPAALLRAESVPLAFLLSLLFAAFASRKCGPIAAMLLGIAGLIGAEMMVKDLLEELPYIENTLKITQGLRIAAAASAFAAAALHPALKRTETTGDN